MVATKNENAKRRNGNKSGNLRKMKSRGNRRMNRPIIDDAMFVDQFDNPGYLDFNCPIITKPIPKNSLKNNFKNRSNRRQQQQQSQGNWAPPLPLLPNGMHHRGPPMLMPPPLPLMPPMNGRMHHRGGPPMLMPPPLPLMPPMNGRMHHRGPPMLMPPPLPPLLPPGGRFPRPMMMPPRPPNMRSNNSTGGGGSMRRNKSNRRNNRNKRKNISSNNKMRSKVINKNNNINQYSLDKPWVNDEIKEEHKKKEELEIKLKGNKNDELFAEFKLQRDKFVSLYETARLEFTGKETTEVVIEQEDEKEQIDEKKDINIPTESDIPETINTEIEAS